MAIPNIESILKNAKNIAVVGLSQKQYRDSHMVAQYLLRNGYNVIAVNPMIDEWEGQKSYPDLLSIQEKVEIINVFRRSEFVPEITEQAIKMKAATLWLQFDVYDRGAVEKAEAAGLNVVSDKCIKIEHMQFA